MFVVHSPPGYQTSDKVLWGMLALLPEVPSCFLAHIIPPEADDDNETSSNLSSAPSPSCVLHVTNESHNTNPNHATNGSNLSHLDHLLMWSNHPSEHQHDRSQHEHMQCDTAETTSMPVNVPFDLEDFLPLV